MPKLAGGILRNPALIDLGTNRAEGGATTGIGPFSIANVQ